MNNDFYYYMNKALDLAREGARNNEVPVGCIIVKNNKIIAQEYNKVRQLNDPTAHCEILAIRKASKALNTYNLDGCSIYVTLEPCPMCTGAIINAKIKNIIFGAYEYEKGSCGSFINLLNNKHAKGISLYGGILEEESSKIMRDFFSTLRSESTNTP